jgi:hypothetical protein
MLQNRILHRKTHHLSDAVSGLAEALFRRMTCISFVVLKEWIAVLYPRPTRDWSLPQHGESLVQNPTLPFIAEYVATLRS